MEIICPKCSYKRTENEQSNTPITNCPECGIAYIKFGHEYTPLPKIKNKSASKQKIDKLPANYTKIINIGSLLLLILTILITSFMDNPKGDGKPEAINMCSAAIKHFAIDRDSVDIPYTKVNDGGNMYYLYWGNNEPSLNMKNGLGLYVPKSASCTIDKATGDLVQLTLDHETMIYNPKYIKSEQ